MQDRANRLAGTETAVDLLYYWHSFGADLGEIFNDRSMQKDLATWKTLLGGRMPVVISLDASPDWIVGKNALDTVQTGLPLIEAKLVKGKSVRRYLLGRSIGARSALTIAAISPSDFKAVAAICPALMLMNPYVPQDVTDYQNRNRTVLNVSLFTRLIRFSMTVIRDSATWTAVDPLNLLADGGYDHLPIYLSVGSADPLGFAEGTSLFYSRLFSRGADVQQSVVDSRLCEWDHAGLANFLNQQIP